MEKIKKLLGIWLYCQITLKETLRWKKYVKYRNGDSVHFRPGMRKQNVVDHTLSKSLIFVTLLPTLKKVLGNIVDFELLHSCIVCHDFGEGLRGTKFDIPYSEKSGSSDAEEYSLFINFLKKNKIDVSTYDYLERAFLLQFVMTSCSAFPVYPRELMKNMRSNRVIKNTAILFQILEKWEYCFYALEHKDKHPKIYDDVVTEQKKNVKIWLAEYPPKYHQPLLKIFF